MDWGREMNFNKKQDEVLYDFSLNVNDGKQLKIILDDRGFLRQYDGIQRCRSPVHTHAYYEIIFIVEGSVILATPSEKFFLNQNDLCCIAPNTVHNTGPGPICPSLSYGSSYKMLSILFSIQTKNQSAKKNNTHFWQGNSSLYLIRQNLTFKTIVDYLQQRIAEFSQPYTEYEKNILSVIFSDLIFSVMKTSLQEKENEENITSDSQITARKYYLNQYISHHYSEDISLDELSQMFFLSKKQIINTIKGMTGLTYRQYVIYLRLIQAENLIANSDNSIFDIAQSVGYNSENGFYQAFKKMFGDTPEGYRKRFRKKESN